MNSRHRETYEQVFANPVNGNIEWRRIEAMLVAVGAELLEGSGSRITVLLNGIRRDFHRPHPGKEALRYRVKDVRELLTEAEINP